MKHLNRNDAVGIQRQGAKKPRRKGTGLAGIKISHSPNGALKIVSKVSKNLAPSHLCVLALKVFSMVSVKTVSVCTFRSLDGQIVIAPRRDGRCIGQSGGRVGLAIGNVMARNKHCRFDSYRGNNLSRNSDFAARCH